MSRQYNAGNAYLQILPSFRGIEKLMQREVGKLAREIDKSIAQGTNDGLLRAFRNVDPEKVAKVATDAADKWSAAFEGQLGRRLKEASDSLPAFEPKTKLNRFDRAIEQTRKQLADLANQKIGPGGDTDLNTVSAALDQVISRMTRLANESKNADQRGRLLQTLASADSLKGLIDDARDAGLTDGRVFGGSFAQAARRQIQTALSALPEINLDADVSGAERAVAALRAQLLELGEKQIGIDIDRDRFMEELAYITAQLESLARDPHSVALKYDLDQAASGLSKFNDKVNPIMEEAAEEAAEVFAGTYANRATSRISKALQALPNWQMTVDHSDADRALAAIRVDMETLSGKEIGFDIHAEDAQEEIDDLIERLRRLDSNDVDINVRVDARAARAELEAIRDKTDDSGQSMLELGRTAGITMSRLGYMIAIGASIGSIIAPAAATAAVAVAGVGIAAAGAAAGIGVLALGLAGIGEAVGKMDDYYKDQDKSTRSLAQANDRIASATDQVANAERGLANTRANNAEAAVEARERIAEAEEDVTKARRDAREALVNAQDADADAQRDLTRANQDQSKARRELNQALRDAVQDLRELDTAVRKNGNEIQQATTASMKAKLELDKLLTNPRASDIEKRMAREKYEEELVRIQSLKDERVTLLKDQQAADRDGVESTKRVKDARDKVAKADEKSADVARRAVKAHANVAKVRLEGAEKIADAQERVADAEASARKTQRQGQQALASGQAQLASAQRALTKAYQGTDVAGGEALDNMRDAMDELSPAGQRFAKFIYGLKPVLKDLRGVAQEGMLPGLQAGIQELLDRYLPGFRNFVGTIAEGLGKIFQATADVLQLPQWQAFFSFIDQNALPSLNGMWVAAVNIATGVANLVMALSPLSKPMGQGLVDMTEKFARWSDQLGTDPNFQEFLEYAKRVGPQVVDLIEQMVEFMGRLVIAMAPIGEFILGIVDATFRWMNSWDVGTLTAVVTTVAILGTAIWGLTALMRTVKFVTEAWNSITLITAKSQSVLAAATARFNTSAVAATTSTGLLNGRLFATGAAGSTAATGMAAMQAAAGPLLLVLAGLAAVWYIGTRNQRAAEEQFGSLGTSLANLGSEYRKAAEASKLGSKDVAESFKNVVQQDAGLKQAVVTMNDLGVSLDTVAAAASGSKEELDAVLDVIQGRIDQLSKEKNENFFDIFDNEERDKEQERLWELEEQFKANAEAAGLTSEAMKILNAQSGANATASQLLTPVQQALADAHEKLGDESATAQQKMDALKAAEDAIRQSAIDAVEAEEAYNGALINLKTTVDQNKDSQDKHATSLELTNETGLRNRDMLEALVTSAGKMYDADVALNGVTEDAVKKGNDHIKAIKETARQLGLNKGQVDTLIRAYNGIPEDVETAIGFKEGAFEKMYTQLEQAAFMQDALRRNLSVTEAKRQWNVLQGQRLYQRYVPNRPGNIPGHADGGPIDGPGTKTSDDVLMWGSKGEYMQRASAVDYYGLDFMHALNSRLIPKDVLPGFAAGGSILGGTTKWPFTIDASKFFVPSTAQLKEQVWGDFTGGGGAGIGFGGGNAGGYKAMEKLIEAAGFGARVTSGFRPGDSGYHGRKRAIDIIFSDGSERRGGGKAREAFNMIASRYGSKTKELIWDFSPWGQSTGIWNGDKHRFRSATSGPGSHDDHIHWAYDQGGFLPPGYSTVYNGTGKPEPVLTAPQWDAVIQGDMSGGGGASGDTINIEFAENRMTIADLEAYQRRRDTLARVGRPR